MTKPRRSAMAASLRANEFATRPLTNGERSHAGVAGQGNRRLASGQARLPAAKRLIIPDLKTAADGAPKAFMRAIANFGYHMSAALYCRRHQGRVRQSADALGPRRARERAAARRQPLRAAGRGYRARPLAEPQGDPPLRRVPERRSLARLRRRTGPVRSAWLVAQDNRRRRDAA
jgi:hypothetical protein